MQVGYYDAAGTGSKTVGTLIPPYVDYEGKKAGMAIWIIQTNADMLIFLDVVVHIVVVQNSSVVVALTQPAIWENDINGVELGSNLVDAYCEVVPNVPKNLRVKASSRDTDDGLLVVIATIVAAKANGNEGIIAQDDTVNAETKVQVIFDLVDG